MNPFRQKPWTIYSKGVLIKSSLEGAMELKFAPFCSSRDALSDGISFGQSQIFQFWPKTMDYIIRRFDRN